jgi:hypothetical protein
MAEKTIFVMAVLALAGTLPLAPAARAGTAAGICKNAALSATFSAPLAVAPQVFTSVTITAVSNACTATDGSGGASIAGSATLGAFSCEGGTGVGSATLTTDVGGAKPSLTLVVADAGGVWTMTVVSGDGTVTATGVFLESPLTTAACATVVQMSVSAAGAFAFGDPSV